MNAKGVRKRRERRRREALGHPISPIKGGGNVGELQSAVASLLAQVVGRRARRTSKCLDANWLAASEATEIVDLLSTWRTGRSQPPVTEVRRPRTWAASLAATEAA